MLICSSVKHHKSLLLDHCDGRVFLFGHRHAHGIFTAAINCDCANDVAIFVVLLGFLCSIFAFLFFIVRAIAFHVAGLSASIASALKRFRRSARYLTRIPFATWRFAIPFGFSTFWISTCFATSSTLCVLGVLSVSFGFSTFWIRVSDNLEALG